MAAGRRRTWLARAVQARRLCDAAAPEALAVVARVVANARPPDVRLALHALAVVVRVPAHARRPWCFVAAHALAEMVRVVAHVLAEIARMAAHALAEMVRVAAHARRLPPATPVATRRPSAPARPRARSTAGPARRRRSAVAAAPRSAARRTTALAAPARSGLDAPVAGWLREPERTSDITTAAQMANTTAHSRKGITPSRMVTPTDPEAHGAGAIPRDASDNGEAASSGAPASPDSRAADRQLATARDAGDQAGAPPGEPPGTPRTPGDGPPSSTSARSTARRNAKSIVGGVVAFMLVAFVVGAAFVPLPYYLFRPGAVRDTEPLIEVDGADVYLSEGSISYTTVSLRQATLLGLAQGWLDDDIDIIDRDLVLGGRDVEENRELNLQMMSNSKQVATQVALERLGYEVDVTVGQLVSEVDEGMPADGEVGVGDVIVAVDDEPFDDADDLGRLLSDEEPGDTVTVTVQSADEVDRDVDLTLAKSPDDPDKAVMGVHVQPVVLDFDFPFDVTIDTGDVGGPSAGLAFTLAIIDDLTPGDLTGGSDVAVTGTISGDGTVGPVGGTGQKAAAAREEGIELFLVPSADYEDAVDHAGDDLEVVPVDTVDQALDALRELGGNVDDLPPAGETAAAPLG